MLPRHVPDSGEQGALEALLPRPRLHHLQRIGQDRGDRFGKRPREKRRKGRQRAHPRAQEAEFYLIENAILLHTCKRVYGEGKLHFWTKP